MFADSFATDLLPRSQQLGAWRGWYEAMFDVTPSSSDDGGFAATNSTWTAHGFTLSRVVSPPNTVKRSNPLIRSNGVDHWVVTLSKQSLSDVEQGDVSFAVPPGTPFILSFGEEMSIRRRTEDERLQLILSRDSFPAIAPLLDAARGTALTTPAGRMLADYMILLEQNVPVLKDEAAARLPNAVQAMLAACVSPTANNAVAAKDQIRLALMERVRRAVHRNLRSPSLGPDKLCREAATSRSQLYRLLEREGGVANYIQRRRLAEGFSLLCDYTNNLSVGKIGELLCFADASTFSRAFRREFGMSPKDVRASSGAGLPPSPLGKNRRDDAAHTFTHCLLAR